MGRWGDKRDKMEREAAVGLATCMYASTQDHVPDLAVLGSGYGGDQIMGSNGDRPHRTLIERFRVCDGPLCLWVPCGHVCLTSLCVSGKSTQIFSPVVRSTIFVCTVEYLRLNPTSPLGLTAWTPLKPKTTI